MPILPTHIKVFLSGGAGNTNPNASLGGVVSTTEVVDNTLHNLFARVTAEQSSAGATHFRAVFIQNTHPTITLEDARVFIQQNTTSPDTHLRISVATEAGSPIQTIETENNAPVGQTFSDAPSIMTALNIGHILPNAVKGLWIERSVMAGGSAFGNDNATLQVFGDTLP